MALKIQKAVQTTITRELSTSFTDVNASLYITGNALGVITEKERFKIYKKVDDIGNDFGKTSETYKTAEAYFANGGTTFIVFLPLGIEEAGTKGSAVTYAVSSSELTNLKTVGIAGFSFKYNDSVVEEALNIDTTGLTDVDSLATLLDGKFANVDITANGNKLKFESQDTGVASNIIGFEKANIVQRQDLSLLFTKNPAKSSATVFGTTTVSSTNIGEFQKITNGGIKIAVNGSVKRYAGIDLSAITDIDGLVTALDTEFGADVTVTKDSSSALLFTVTTSIGDPEKIDDIVDLSNVLSISGKVNGRAKHIKANIADTLDEIENTNESTFIFIGILLDREASKDGYLETPQFYSKVFRKDYAVFVDVDIQEAKKKTSLIVNQAEAFYNGLSGSDSLRNGNVCMFATDMSADKDFLASAYLGYQLAKPIGKQPVKFIKPQLVQPSKLTSSELTNIIGKRVNVYTGTLERAGIAFVKEGSTMHNEVFIDTLLGSLWIKIQLEDNVYKTLLSSKVPMNTDGFSLLESQVMPVFERAVSQGIINDLAVGEITYEGHEKATNFKGYNISFEVADFKARELKGNMVYFDNVSAHFVFNSVTIALPKR